MIDINCCCSDCGTVEWSRIVGDKTVQSGGQFGDLMTLIRAHINDAKDNGELTEAAAGQVMASAMVEAMRQAVHFELNYKQAQAQICLTMTQQNSTEQEMDLKKRQIDAEIEKTKCMCDIEKQKIAQQIKTDDEKIKKMQCDCENSTKVMNAQADLYRRQAAGFDDHSNLKLLEIQSNATAAMFADQDGALSMPYIFKDSKLCNTYDRIVQRLNGHFDSDGNFIPGPGESC